jgi:transcription factor C subunit 6
VDPFDGLEKALYASSDSGSSTTSAAPDDDSEQDVDFVVPPEALEEEEDEEEDLDDVVASSESDQDIDEDNTNEPDDDELVLDDMDLGPVEEYQEIERFGRDDIPGQRALLPRLRNLKGQRYRTEVTSDTHTRGVDEFRTKGAKEQRVSYMFGPTDEDIEPVLKTRDKWLWDPTLPSRKANGDGIGGMGPSYYVPRERKEKETSQTRRWYMEQGAKDAFTSGQKTKLLTSAEGQRYLPRTQYNDHSFLTGPLNRQKLFTLKTWESARISAPFEDDRPGFILNLGATILDLQWAPTVQGSMQYLAIVLKQENPYVRKGQNVRSPTYTPQLPFPASFQIWRFKSLDDGKVDPQSPPHLEVVICTDWGNAKQLKWCPVTMADSAKSDDGTSIHLGLLAVIWGDGNLRILDIKYPKFASTAYLHITRAAFESRPTNTVCTCLTWVSPRTIAAGTAIGTLAIWTLDDKTLSPSEPRPDTVPWFYFPVHDSYILSLDSAYPSRPCFLSTLCADGYIRLIDIRSPAMDTMLTPRQRIFCIPLCWHDHTQSFVAADENFYIRILSLRRFYMSNLILRAPSFVTCAATSSTHPIVLTGGAGGEVVTGNPLRRALDVKCESWQQTWFTYEYRRPVQPPSSKLDPSLDSSTSAHSPKDMASRPLSRFITGHQPTTQLLQPRNREPAVASIRAQRNAEGSPATDGPRPPTIFEEEQAVTALAWNPNPIVGGWAAAGLGSGLLRVEDLCV